MTETECIVKPYSFTSAWESYLVCTKINEVVFLSMQKCDAIVPRRRSLSETEFFLYVCVCVSCKNEEVGRGSVNFLGKHQTQNDGNVSGV